MATPRATIVVALVGNPNTGKTTLFNALTGFRRHVANYPGVTVDIGRGAVLGSGRPMELLDLPGTYSLAAVSPDEQVVRDALCPGPGERPDIILAITDASNLSRNLYLVSQLLELGLPVVVALNMVDIARGRGLEIDHAKLSERLGVPVVPVVATESHTVNALVSELERAVRLPPPTQRAPLPAMLVREAATLNGMPEPLTQAEGIRVLLDRAGCAERAYLQRGGSAARLAEARARLAAGNCDCPAAEVRARYAWIHKLLEGVILRPEKPVVTWSDRLDRVLTHKIGGAVALLAMLYIVFQSIFYWAGPLMAGIERAFELAGGLVGTVLPEGVLRSLIVDGVIAGVGGVLVFLPQIMILFAFLAILEDCGYMARAAFMMDRIMRALGLSGRAFIPLLSGFACAVPAIMGTRAIAERRERAVATLIIPFMSCSARLPIYLVLIAAFVPDAGYLGGLVRAPALVMLGMYVLGVLVAIPVAWVLKKTAFAGPAPGFLLELPSYKLPRPRMIWQRMWFSGKDFVLRAGTIILAVNLVVWALAYFPHSERTRLGVGARAAAEGWTADRTAAELSGAYLRESYLGRMGHALEPAIRPLGWDWRIGVSVIASFPAREVVVATLGTLFNLGGEQEGSRAEPASGGVSLEKGASLRDSLRRATWEDSGAPLFTLPVALSIMVFYALCAQCASTLVTIGRELRSSVWPVVSFVGMTLMAYAAAWGIGAAARIAGL